MMKNSKNIFAFKLDNNLLVNSLNFIYWEKDNILQRLNDLNKDSSMLGLCFEDSPRPRWLWLLLLILSFSPV